MENTKNYCVIGNPISHSLSPLIYNYLFQHYNINAKYSAKQVLPEDLDSFVSFARNNLAGFNITIPHKINIIEKLDVIDCIGESAKLYSSANTIINNNKTLSAYSTDARGFELSLFEFNKSFEHQKVVIIGNGGAANAIIKLAENSNPKSICVAARSPKSSLNSRSITTCSLSNTDLKNACDNANLLINTTPLGMENYKYNFENFEFLDLLNKNATVYDIVYKPRETSLLKQAKNIKNKNLTCIDGLGMLIWQAFAAFEIFTGILPEKELRNLVTAKLLNKLS